MLSRIKALPHKTSFAIGLTLTLISGLLPNNIIWSTFVRGIIIGVGFLFIPIASDKKHSSKDKVDKE